MKGRTNCVPDVKRHMLNCALTTVELIVEINIVNRLHRSLILKYLVETCSSEGINY